MLKKGGGAISLLIWSLMKEIAFSPFEKKKNQSSFEAVGGTL